MEDDVRWYVSRVRRRKSRTFEDGGGNMAVRGEWRGEAEEGEEVVEYIYYLARPLGAVDLLGGGEGLTWRNCGLVCNSHQMKRRLCTVWGWNRGRRLKKSG
jgi:hypothetical protein